jgi:hypothetical protein
MNDKAPKGEAQGEASPRASQPATAEQIIRRILAEADAFLSRPDADPLDLDLVRRARFDVEAYGFELVKMILAAGEPEMAETALEWLAAVLQGVHLIGWHAGRPETAIQEGIQLTPLIQITGARSIRLERNAPWDAALDDLILTITAEAGNKRLSRERTRRRVATYLCPMKQGKKIGSKLIRNAMDDLDHRDLLPKK